MPTLQQNRYRNYIFPLLLLIFATTSRVLMAQDDCGSKIQEARKYYEQGMIEEIPQMLAPCMENGFTRTQKIEAYKLIILSYLFDDNQFEAEKTMVEFLTKFPEYEIMPNDPVEFVYLFESYRTTSIFSFGFTAGINLTDPRIIQPFSTFDTKNASFTNSMKPGFQVGIGVGRYISRKLFLNVELKFSENQYSFKDEMTASLPGLNSIHSVSYKERLYKLMVPLTVAYEFNGKKAHYFIRSGVGVSKITGVTGTVTRQYAEDIPPVTGETQNMAGYRKNFLYSGIIGTGVRYKVPHGVLTAEVRANFGLNNIVKSEKRYDNMQQIMQSSYLDDDFSLNVFSFSAGYYFSFYRPKKQADK